MYAKLILKLLRGTIVLLNEFAAKQQKRDHKLEGNSFCKKTTTSRDGPVKSPETRQG